MTKPVIVKLTAMERNAYRRRKQAPERIRAWVAREFAPRLLERVTQDLIDVATGNRCGNRFETEALDQIFPEWKQERDALINGACDAQDCFSADELETYSKNAKKSPTSKPGG